MIFALKSEWFPFIGMIFLVTSCVSNIKPTATPSVRPTWIESMGRFYTRDIARAQAEIPFTIILPSYIPDKRKNIPPPSLTGPLKRYRADAKEAELEILYGVELEKQSPGVIRISETNSPLLPLDPELNPAYKTTEIRGIKMVKTEGAFPDGAGVIYYFNQRGIYFIVRIVNMPGDEAIKIVESMLR